MRNVPTVKQRKCCPKLLASKNIKRRLRKSDVHHGTVDRFKNLNELKRPLVCCGLSFHTNVDFALHSKVHDEEGRYTCHLCDYKKLNEVNIIKHVMRHDVFKCEVCNKIFKRKSSANKHSRMHATKKPEQCEICGKQLSNPKNLRLHREMVHSTEKLIYHSCTICNKKYKSSSSLRRHCSYNHRELGIDMSVICEVCGKSISTKGGLQVHLKTHASKKPFPCNVCANTFATKSFLSAHMVKHTGEKPFICKYCGKSYGHGSAFRYHVRTHTGDRPYTCQFCGKGFITNANKKLHIKSCYVTN